MLDLDELNKKSYASELSILIYASPLIFIANIYFFSECKEEADKLFEDVLKCKDRADSTRSAINVLKRFHFLFFLPVNTERNIQKGDYDVVINDFARAKSLFGDTEIPVSIEGL